MNKNTIYLGIAILVALAVIFYGNKIKAMASAGNPNNPPPQNQPSYGPQGPNDGSNNYGGSGSFKFPW